MTADDFKYIYNYARQLKGDYGARNSMCDEMERFVLMHWLDEAEVKRQSRNAKITIDPTPRNRLMGAIRLLVAADPKFSVPAEKNPALAEEMSEKLVEAAAQIWSGAGRVAKRPVHYETVYSLLTFGEVHHYVTSTKDLLKTIETGDRKGQTEGVEMKRLSKAARAQVEEAARLTPFLIEAGDVRTGYPDLGPLGLSAFYHCSTVRAGKVLEKVGKLPAGYTNPFQNVTFHRFWDLTADYIWIDSMKDEPLYQVEHNLPSIPVSVQIGEGTRLTSKYEDQRWPFLYTLLRSGLWERQNLTLTVLFTLVATLGFNPQFVNKLDAQGNKAVFDFSTPGGVAYVPFGGDLAPMFNKGLIDPSVGATKQIADDLIEQSTIYGQTLGEPLSGNAPFAMVSLLHQAGRLPLIIPQRLGSWCIGDTLKLCLDWWKEEGIPAGYYAGALDTLQASEIPPRYELQADLDITLPQDDLQAAQVALSLTQGDNPLTSNEYARKHYLKIEQSKKMTRAIWDERASQMTYGAMLTDFIAKLQRLQNPPPPPPNAGNGTAAPGGLAPNQLASQAQGMMEGGQAPPMMPAPAPAAPMAPGANSGGGMLV